ncbi:uncharacterized protein LOC110067699 [Orbicella faveolata]|uniref:uncharacterized protein LOC110067699 n=1 Tax=Orbicella faveolata TaxID=48498 RepID=UPI0009E60905|nr:uncharacterized protein LOC110067699 [Orbicella faveolata]
MRLALVFGVCLTLVFLVESFVEDEFVEDEEDEENESRHHLRKCKVDEDCNTGECCRTYGHWWWYRSRCFAQRKENERCLEKTSKYSCHYGCADGLECRRSGPPSPPGAKPPHPHRPRHPHPHHRGKCVRPLPPTEEPGSGDMDDF